MLELVSCRVLARQLTATVEPLRPAPLSINIILKLLKRATEAAMTPNKVGRHFSGNHNTGTCNNYMMEMIYNTEIYKCKQHMQY